jgi:serine/threonine protein kinase
MAATWALIIKPKLSSNGPNGFSLRCSWPRASSAAAKKDTPPGVNMRAVLGLEYLHRENIIHNDIKEKNVLVFNIGSKKVLKFTDFGSCFCRAFQLFLLRNEFPRSCALVLISTFVLLPHDTNPRNISAEGERLIQRLRSRHASMDGS